MLRVTAPIQILLLVTGLQACGLSVISKQEQSTRSPSADLKGLPPSCGGDEILKGRENTASRGTLVVDVEGTNSSKFKVTKKPTKGEVKFINATIGTFGYIPIVGEFGSDEFGFEVEMNGSKTAKGLCRVEIKPTGVHNPVGVRAKFVIDEDTPLEENLAAKGGLHPENYAFELVDKATLGDVELLDAKDGSFRYSPRLDFDGEDFFTFRVSDGEGQSVVERVEISIRAVNDNPRVADAAYPVLEDAARFNGVLVGSDIESLEVTFSIDTDGQKGHAFVDDPLRGNFHYTPNPGESGTDTFKYKVRDGNGGESVATITMNIVGQIDDPVALDSSITVPEDAGPQNKTFQIDNVDNVPVVFALVNGQGPTKGVVQITNAATGAFTYDPNDNAEGSDSFKFHIGTGSPPFFNSMATVSVTITPSADDPVASNDTYNATVGDGAIMKNLVPLVTDVDVGDTKTFSTVTGPTKGSHNLSAEGALTYTPFNDATGTDTLTYKVTDRNGRNDNGVITINITQAQNRLAYVGNHATVTSASDRPIKSLAFDSSTLYFVTVPGLVGALNATNPADLSDLGRVGCGQNLRTMVLDPTVVYTGGDTIRATNFSNPNSAVCETRELQDNISLGMDHNGTRIYNIRNRKSSAEGKFQIINKADLAPVTGMELNHADLFDARDLVYLSNHVLILTNDRLAAITTNEASVGGLLMRDSKAVNGSPFAMKTFGTRAFIVGSSGLQVWNLTNPTNLQFIALTPLAEGTPSALRIVSNNGKILALVSAKDKGLYVFDVTTVGAAPSLIRRFEETVVQGDTVKPINIDQFVVDNLLIYSTSSANDGVITVLGPLPNL